MQQEKMKEIVENYVRAYNAFDVEAMLAQLHQDVVFRNVSNGETTMETNGLDEFRQAAEQATQMFASRQQTITSTE